MTDFRLFLIQVTPPSAPFELFSTFPRQRLLDDSQTLGDLGLVPSGVLHLRTTAKKKRQQSRQRVTS